MIQLDVTMKVRCWYWEPCSANADTTPATPTAQTLYTAKPMALESLSTSIDTCFVCHAKNKPKIIIKPKQKEKKCSGKCVSSTAMQSFVTCIKQFQTPSFIDLSFYYDWTNFFLKSLIFMSLNNVFIWCTSASYKNFIEWTSRLLTALLSLNAYCLVNLKIT